MALDRSEQTLHPVLQVPYTSPFPENSAHIFLGMGCFWGAERRLWQQPGVLVTAVGYGGGWTESPTYQQICRGDTGHCELVLVVYDPQQLDLEDLFALFWQAHDPTQGLRQGNDIGPQYRSALYTTSPEQTDMARLTRRRYQAALHEHGFGDITTELREAPPFTYAEDYHQQYLAKNPSGYCGLRGTGVAYPR